MIPHEFIEPALFVSIWFHKTKAFIMKPNGSYNGESRVDCDRMLADYDRQYRALPKPTTFNEVTGKLNKLPPKMTDVVLTRAWDIFLVDEAMKSRASLISAIKFTNDIYYSELVTWLMGVTEEASDFEVNVMKHVLWQIKRKALGLSVVHHLCPTFYGKQNGGKTTAILKLLEPIKPLVLDWSVADAIDTRNAQPLADNLVVLLDELAGMQRADIAAVKRLISTDQLSYRPLFTNRQIKVKQNCTIIGISNKSLTENVYDSTGLRRFVEFKCLDNLDWGLINKVDALKLWQSIDENRDRGYYELIKDQLHDHQSSMMIKDEIQSFIEESGIASDLSKTIEISAKKLWESYRDWRSTSGFSGGDPIKLNSLCMRLRTYGLKKRDIKRQSYYTISAASTISETTSLQNTPTELQWVNKGVRLL
jgi:hypothetical protein